MPKQGTPFRTSNREEAGGMDWMRRHERIINWAWLLGWGRASSLSAKYSPQRHKGHKEITNRPIY
jgi:hypothetical protein